MARRELVRRLNLDLSPDERPGYHPETVNTLVDWICESETFDQQNQRIQKALDRLKVANGED